MFPTQNANYAIYSDMIQDGIFLYSRHIIISIIITNFVIFPSPFVKSMLALYHKKISLSIGLDKFLYILAVRTSHKGLSDGIYWSQTG